MPLRKNFKMSTLMHLIEFLWAVVFWNLILGLVMLVMGLVMTVLAVRQVIRFVVNVYRICSLSKLWIIILHESYSLHNLSDLLTAL